MKKVNIFFFAFALMGTLAGCKKDFFDINQNPNSAVESNITPDLALAAQLSATAARNAGTYAFLNRWLGYWSASGSYRATTLPPPLVQVYGMAYIIPLINTRLLRRMPKNWAGNSIKVFLK
jgi:hypothetical protein